MKGLIYRKFLTHTQYYSLFNCAICRHAYSCKCFRVCLQPAALLKPILFYGLHSTLLRRLLIHRQFCSFTTQQSVNIKELIDNMGIATYSTTANYLILCFMNRESNLRFWQQVKFLADIGIRLPIIPKASYTYMY